jgi:hypothetical protein
MESASMSHQLYQYSAETSHCAAATLTKLFVWVQRLPSAFPHGTESSTNDWAVPSPKLLGITVVSFVLFPWLSIEIPHPELDEVEVLLFTSAHPKSQIDPKRSIKRDVFCTSFLC